MATFTLQRGEMLWVDNPTTLHDRTAYEDDPGPQNLLRQWVVWGDRLWDDRLQDESLIA